MNPWSIAIGNIDGSNPRPAVFDEPAAPPPAERKPAPSERPTCPHCGAPMKLPNGPKPWTSDEDAVLVEMFHSGRSRRAIAAAVGRAPSSVGSRIATLRLAFKRHPS